jgi:hypothetical protein
VAPKYKGKGKQVLNQNASKINVSANSDCYYCNSKSHWTRNCPRYLEDLKSGRDSEVSVSGIFVIEIKVTQREVQLRVENGARVAAVTVGRIGLYLPSGLVMELENVYFVPIISRNIIYLMIRDKWFLICYKRQ